MARIFNEIVILWAVINAIAVQGGKEGEHFVVVVQFIAFRCFLRFYQ